MGECPCWSDEHYDRGDGVMVCGQCGVAKCSLCEGEGRVLKNAGVSSPGRPEIVTCPECDGTGEAPDSATPPRKQVSLAEQADATTNRPESWQGEDR